MSEHKILSEAEIRALLADTLENLFEIEPERIKRETGRKLNAEDFRNVRTVDDVVQAVLKVQAADSGAQAQ